MEVCYIELDNRRAGVEYSPMENSWDGESLCPLLDDEWLKERKICCRAYMYNMSWVWLLTVPRECAGLPGEWRRFAVAPDAGGKPPCSSHGVRFREWTAGGTGVDYSFTDFTVKFKKDVDDEE